MVEDDVENDLDPRAVEGLHEVAELLERAVAVVRGEVGDRVVAPVIAVGGVELEYRQQLDRADAQVDQVGDLLLQRGERSGTSDFRAGRAREAADVELVDDRLLERARERPVALPVVGPGVDDDAAERGGDVVAGKPRRRSDPRARVHAARVRVKQHLVAVKTELATARAARPKPVDRPGCEPGTKACQKCKSRLERNHPR